MFNSEIGLATEGQQVSCAGLGLSFCTTIASVDTSLTAAVSKIQSRVYGEEHTTSATLGFSFEYTTSDDIEKAGNRSDMFLTPALNVKFAKSAEITFDKASCAAGYKEIVTWSLDSETNVPVRRESLC